MRDKAKWVYDPIDGLTGPIEDYKCSKCGMNPSWTVTPKEILTPYCPWCGSEMEIETEDEDGV